MKTRVPTETPDWGYTRKVYTKSCACNFSQHNFEGKWETSSDIKKFLQANIIWLKDLDATILISCFR